MPIVTTKYHSTAAEIEKNKAGIIVLTDQEGETYTETIRELFDNYSLYSKNSKKL
jgi:5S rRNA maturation endonuclease (ribonuclease M5)